MIPQLEVAICLLDGSTVCRGQQFGDNVPRVGDQVVSGGEYYIVHTVVWHSARSFRQAWAELLVEKVP